VSRALRNLYRAPIPVSSSEGDDLAMRLLVVEDDTRLADQLRRGLRADGYAVDCTGTAQEAHWVATENDYDAVILDIGLPDGDGFTLCEQLRSGGRWSPILMLTARDAVSDRVRGLDVGADDYVLKPFSFTELSARIRALVRRGAPERPPVLRIGALELDRARRTVRLSGRAINLSVREFALLELFMRRKDEVLTRAEIIEHVWDWAYDGTSNVVDWHVMALRQRLAAGGEGPRIETVRGVGYVLR
jgi:two-component system, OmpR family, response regulator